MSSDERNAGLIRLSEGVTPSGQEAPGVALLEARAGRVRGTGAYFAARTPSTAQGPVERGLEANAVPKELQGVS